MSMMADTDEQSLYTIEQVATRTGFTKRTLRYYEEVGLLCQQVVPRETTGATAKLMLSGWNASKICATYWDFLLRISAKLWRLKMSEGK